MPAPHGSYTAPASSPLAGQIFRGTGSRTSGYNQYLQANAKALGYDNYNQQKAARIGARRIFVEEKAASRFGVAGKLTPQSRMQLNQIIAQFRGQDMKNRQIGGPLDRFLQALGRRTGNETYPVGETP